MRIACLHIPQLSLQCATRLDPALRGAAVVVAGVLADVQRGKPTGAGPVVLACSRAAWAVGARVGMTATAARQLDDQILVVSAEAGHERETIRALADALLSLTPVVDVGGRVGAGGAHLAMYCEVPSKTRGSSFGERLMQQLEALGLTGRIGIADDRFTAWVAASSSPSSGTGAGHGAESDDDNIVSVPRGGSAASLSPRPLSLLAISAEVQHMLESLGVTTLGEFAGLPAPSVARPLEADYQALARGEGGQTLRPYAPEAPIREEIVIAHGANANGQGLSLAAAVGTLAERVALRLEGRARGAARLELVVTGPGGPGGERMIPIVPVASARARTSLEAMLVKPGESKLISSSDAVADAISTAIHGEEQIWRLKITVTGEAIAGEESNIDDLAEAEAPGIVDTLSVVLSNTGGSLDLGLAFGPMSTAPGPTAGVLRDRREAHQRTRRTRRHRTRPNSVIQPKLFKS
jgi:hypothetical protein